jgi:hypothetical protein
MSSVVCAYAAAVGGALKQSVTKPRSLPAGLPLVPARPPLLLQLRKAPNGKLTLCAKGKYVSLAPPATA